MIANVLKTIGLCLTTLTNFNVVEQRNTELFEGGTMTANEIVTSQSYQVSDPLTPYPINNVYVTTWYKQTTAGNVKVQWIQSVTRTEYNSHTAYQLRYNNYPMTYQMLIVSFTGMNTPAETQVNFNFWASDYFSTYNIDKPHTYIINNEYVVNPYISAQFFETLELNDSIAQFTGNDTDNYGFDLWWYIFQENYSSISQRDINAESKEKQNNEYYNGLDYYEPNLTQKTAIFIYTITYESVSTDNYARYNADRTNFHLADSNEDIEYSILSNTITGNIEYEVVDIPGLAFNILTMPFTFISTAFNITLFPGTPYQVNITNLILSLIGILAFILIVKLLMRR